MLRTQLLITVAAISVLVGPLCTAQPPGQKVVREADPAGGATEDDASAEERQGRLASMRLAAADYTISLDADGKKELQLQSEPVLRWTNPVRGTTDGAVFIWLLDGRPEVATGIYKWSARSGEPDMEHEFSSLSLRSLRAVRSGNTVWETAKPGVELQSLPGAAAPADSKPMRLRQMRSLAKEFTAFHNNPNKPAEELRLLAQPIYRYEKTRDPLLDGGLFAFTQATDPEVLLLIEARRAESGVIWQYGIARMTSVALRVRHLDHDVWQAPNCWAQVTDRRAPYTAFFRQKIGRYTRDQRRKRPALPPCH